MKQQTKTLREVTSTRTVGFSDAVADLGTHTVAGTQVPYSRGQVYKVLKGEHKSERLLNIIAERRPDLFGLRFVADEVRRWASARGLVAAFVALASIAVIAKPVSTVWRAPVQNAKHCEFCDRLQRDGKVIKARGIRSHVREWTIVWNRHAATCPYQIAKRNHRKSH